MILGEDVREDEEEEAEERPGLERVDDAGDIDLDSSLVTVVNMFSNGDLLELVEGPTLRSSCDSVVSFSVESSIEDIRRSSCDADE